METTILGVGDPVRQRTGFAVIASLAIVTAYGAITIFAKEIRGLEVRQPWQDDPYDVPVSFAFVFLPLLVFIGELRVQLCRRAEPLPTRRLVDLLRLCAVAVGVSGLTELAAWTAVALGRHNRQWTAATTWQVVALCVLSGATLGCGLLIYRARRNLASCAVDGQPDWLSDAILLCLRQARRLGPFRTPAEMGARCLERNVIRLVRARPIATATLLAVVLALPFVAAKALLEQYPAPLLAFVFALSAASMFGFLVIAGRLLRVVAPRISKPSSWLCAAVVAALVDPAVFAFHDSLLAAIHVRQTAGSLSIFLFGGGLAAGVIALVTQTSVRRIRS